MSEERLNLSDLKAKSPADLLSMAEEWEIENASTMRKGEMMFSILKEHAEEGFEIGGDGVLEVVQDGFELVRVDGNHDTLVLEPNATTLVRALRTTLDETQASRFGATGPSAAG